MGASLRLTGLLFGIALFLLSVVGCNNQKQTATQQPSIRRSATDSTIAARPLAAPVNTSGEFVSVAATDSGLDFTNTVTDKYLLDNDVVLQGGVASGDIDADGDLDLYLTNLDGPNKLYRNEGGLKFTDITAEAGAGLDCGEARSCGAYMVDLNSDGRLDLYVCNRLEANQLFYGMEGGHFEEVKEAAGLGDPNSSVAAAFFDADQDGDLDVYVANHRRDNNFSELFQAWANKQLNGIEPAYTNPHSRLIKAGIAPKGAKLPAELENAYYLDPSGVARIKPDPDSFYENDGKGNFVDATRKAGFTGVSWSMQPLACDFNNDGLTDLYVSSDFETPDRYFINNGNGTFTDRAPDMVRKTPLYSMGCDAGDLNGDGLMDLWTSDMLAKDYKRGKTQSGDMYQWRWEFLYGEPQPQMRNMLYVNRGDGWMTECAQMVGAAATEWTWSARISDLNADGIPELLATNGMTRDSMDVDNINKRAELMAKGATQDVFDDLSENQEPYYTDDFIFTAAEPLQYSQAVNNWGLKDASMGCGTALEDFDGDGDRDMVMNNTNKPAGLWRNETAQSAMVSIDLRQSGPNHFAAGARVTADAGGRKLVQDVILSRGYATGESGRLYFGLGDAAQIDSLQIRWPDNTLQEYEGLPAGSHYTITRADELPKWQPEVIETLFSQSELGWKQEEADTQLDEFEAEPLLPIQQSTLGTGAGVADYNGDGNLDVYLAGPNGQGGRMFKGDGKGGFSEDGSALPAASNKNEEMAALWFDANGDKQNDLLLTIGGVEGTEAGYYQPRLLLAGDSGFTATELPQRDISTGAAAAADIDADGDLDLFLGGHRVRHAYGVTAPSALWLNDGAAKFRPAGEDAAPGLSNVGQVNDAQFAELTGDGQPDLALALNWGAVEVWKNDGGKFSRAGKLTQAGWWQSLGIADYDNDGDLDILAGNLGNNTKYHPKEGAPVTMFAHDFDNSGTRDLVEVKYGKLDGKECMLPGRGRSCSGYAINYIPQKWATWHQFADATLEEVYGAGLSKAQRFDVTDVHSLLLINEGGGNFQTRELPDMAQWAPVFGIAPGDYNCDGNLDVVLANNFALSQPEAGHWNAGYGLLLLGDGSGSFNAVDRPNSGISVECDARSAIAGDFNGDALLDVLVSASSSTPRLLTANSGQVKGSGLLVTLDGPSVGARAELKLADGKSLVREAQAGSGYLGSYAGPLHFGIPEGSAAESLTVRWPDGSTSDATVSGDAVTVAHGG